jgi:hypothetical protein
VYPNPAKELISIKTDWKFTEADIELRDILGKLIWSGIYSGQDLDVHTLSPGTYFIRLTEGKVTRTAKFLKW